MLKNIYSLLKYADGYAGQAAAFFARAYQLTLSPDHSSLIRARHPFGYCPFYPTCSEYSRQTFRKQGFAKGLVMSLWRLLRCNPGRQPAVHLP